MGRRKYSVKKIFGPTLQGEGSLVGEVTAFVRFSGCNMWDGRPQTKGSSRCPFCDTDFFDGDLLTAEQIVDQLKLLLPHGWVTLSGGEPLLQLDYDLADSLVHAGYRLCVETNGTRLLSHDVKHLLSHVVMSPKVPRDEVRLKECDDLKLLFPHPDPRITPESFADFPAKQRFLQPINKSESYDLVNIRRTMTKLYDMNTERDLDADGWRMSTQAHKALGIE